MTTRDTDVKLRLQNRQANSAPNSRPAAMPGVSEPSRSNIRLPRDADHAQSSRAAPADRKLACSTGDMLEFATLMATCWKPQMAHNTNVRLAAGRSRRSRISRGVGLTIVKYIPHETVRQRTMAVPRKPAATL